MSNQKKQFFAPFKEKHNNRINLVVALGIFPAVMLGRNYGSVWITLGIILLWWFIVVLSYLTYHYLKSK